MPKVKLPDLKAFGILLLIPWSFNLLRFGFEDHALTVSRQDGPDSGKCNTHRSKQDNDYIVNDFQYSFKRHDNLF